MSVYNILNFSIKNALSAYERNKDTAITHNHETYYGNFDRFYSIYNELELDRLIQYVFIVRPDLNILDENDQLPETCKNDNYLKYIKNNHGLIFKCLTDRLSDSHDFIPFLVGRTESLQIPDITLKTNTINQPFTNITMPYAVNMWESLTGGTFDITFREDNELRVHKLFQTWIYYIDGVTRNLFPPKSKYINYNKFDYMSSVYYIICKPDGQSVVWWNKYTGVFPTSVPNSDLSFNLRGSVDNKVTIPFTYFMQDVPLNPMILLDFNKNSAGERNYNTDNPKREFTKGYDSDVLGMGNGLVGSPFISGSIYNPKLNWSPYIPY